MDINACLAEIRSIASEILSNPETSTDREDRLAELIESLDGWITHGGFLPKRWQPVTLTLEGKRNAGNTR